MMFRGKKWIRVRLLSHLSVLGPITVAHIFQGNIADTSRWNTPHGQRKIINEGNDRL